MPSGRKRYYRKRYKRYKKKRSYKRKMNRKYSFRGARRLRGITHWKTGPPSTMPIKLVYCQNYRLTDLVGNANNLFFRLNDIFDPVQGATVGEHQPYGFDQFFAASGTGLFQTFRVKSTKISVKAINQTSDVNDGQVFICGGTTYNTAAAPFSGGSTEDAYEEAPEFQCRFLGLPSASNNTAYLKNYYKIKKLFRFGYTDDLNTGDWTTSPPTPCYYMFRVVPVTVGAAYDVYIMVRMTFYAIAKRNVNFAQS